MSVVACCIAACNNCCCVFAGLHCTCVALAVSIKNCFVDTAGDVVLERNRLNIGFAAGTQLTYRAPLFLETGLYYSQKGGKSGSGHEKFTYDLNYLEVPLIIKYKHFVGNQTSIQPYAGAYLAVGTDGEIKNYGTRTAFSSYENGYFNRFDGGLKLGCGVGFNMLYLDASYDIGLANIGQDSFDDTHNGCFTINLGVNF